MGVIVSNADAVPNVDIGDKPIYGVTLEQEGSAPASYW